MCAYHSRIRGFHSWTVALRRRLLRLSRSFVAFVFQISRRDFSRRFSNRAPPVQALFDLAQNAPMAQHQVPQAFQLALRKPRRSHILR